jgi:hypothetical protein
VHQREKYGKEDNTGRTKDIGYGKEYNTGRTKDMGWVSHCAISTAVDEKEEEEERATSHSHETETTSQVREVKPW